jgi:ADP-heptose:LPS heptosyltransferase
VGSKQWPLKYFQRLIDTIRECTNRQVVVVGSAADQDVAHAVYVKGEFIRAVAALLKHALLYIGLDSGITHIVSTFTVPIIAIHPSTFPEVTGALADDITFISGSEVNGQKHVVPFEAVFGEVERRLKG